MRERVRGEDRIQPRSTRQPPDDHRTRTDQPAHVPRLLHQPLDRPGRLLGSDPFGGFDEAGGLGQLQPPGRLIDIPSDTPREVAELAPATQQNLRLHDASRRHDEYCPSGVGATTDCRRPTGMVRTDHHVRTTTTTIVALKRWHRSGHIPRPTVGRTPAPTCARTPPDLGNLTADFNFLATTAPADDLGALHPPLRRPRPLLLRATTPAGPSETRRS
jgi:hypothetical protein